MIPVFLLLLTFFGPNALAQKNPNPSSPSQLKRKPAAKRSAPVKVKYRKYTQFRFDEIGIGGDGERTGNLSIGNRTQRKFKNRLPTKPNFNSEISWAVEKIQ